MGNLRILALVVLTGALAGTTGIAADDPADLHILKARIDFGPRPGTDRLELKAAFDPARLIAGLTPENSDLAVTVGPVAVISLPPRNDRMRLRSKKERIWRLRVKPTREHRDSLKLRLHVEKGKLKLIGERLDLRDVQGGGAEEVTFTLTVAGTTFTKTIELGVKDRRWRYRYAGPAFVPSEPGGIPPIDPGDPPDTIEFRDIATGRTKVDARRYAVCRTRDEFVEEWKRFDPTWQEDSLVKLPEVDFVKEIVLVIDQGWFPEHGYRAEITEIRESGHGLHVEWTALTPVLGEEMCRRPASPSAFYRMIAVTRRDGPVTFQRTDQNYFLCEQVRLPE